MLFVAACGCDRPVDVNLGAAYALDRQAPARQVRANPSRPVAPPWLVGDLILAVTDAPAVFRFLTDEAAQIRGYDGVLVSIAWWRPCQV
jgi:hypothetical protein